jgi:hypothetical protein
VNAQARFVRPPDSTVATTPAISFSPAGASTVSSAETAAGVRIVRSCSRAASRALRLDDARPFRSLSILGFHSE